MKFGVGGGQTVISGEGTLTVNVTSSEGMAYCIDCANSVKICDRVSVNCYLTLKGDSEGGAAIRCAGAEFDLSGSASLDVRSDATARSENKGSVYGVLMSSSAGKMYFNDNSVFTGDKLGKVGSGYTAKAGIFGMRGGSLTVKGDGFPLNTAPFVGFDYRYFYGLLSGESEEEAYMKGRKDPGSLALTQYVHYVSYLPMPNRSYGIWVNGVEVTNANSSGIKCGDGTVKYGVDYHGLEKLTLTDCTITMGAAVTDPMTGATAYGGIVSEESLVIELVGNNYIDVDFYGGACGVAVLCDLDDFTQLRFTGTGSLFINAHSQIGNAYGIAADYIYAEDGDVRSYAASDAQNAYGIFVQSNIRLEHDCEFYAESAAAAGVSYGVYVSRADPENVSGGVSS